ncbi:MAG: hypothetical protein ACRC0X_00745 [Brevinema sp.]
MGKKYHLSILLTFFLSLLTPLHLAAEKSPDDITELLLRHKAEVSAVINQLYEKRTLK